MGLPPRRDMPSKREYLRYTTVGAIAALAGCAGLVPTGSDSEGDSKSCTRTTEIRDEYDFSRSGQIQAKPVDETSDEWTEIQFADCLHEDVQTAVKNAYEMDDVRVRDISATVRENVRRNLHSYFGVTQPKFYVGYQGTTLEIKVVQYD